MSSAAKRKVSHSPVRDTTTILHTQHRAVTKQLARSRDELSRLRDDVQDKSKKINDLLRQNTELTFELNKLKD